MLWGLLTVGHILHAGLDVKDIRDRVYALNEFMQRQLEEANRRYMELYEWHENDKE